MLFGLMNNPANSPIKEINKIGRMGFDFVDLTLEEPGASATYALANIKKIKAALRKNNLEVVGHTAWYLEVGSPYLAVRQAVLKDMQLCVRAFSKLGAESMTIHPHPPALPRVFKAGDRQLVDFTAQTLNELTAYARRFGISIMIENIPGGCFSTPRGMAVLLKKVPGAQFHLYVGHANVGVIKNRSPAFLALLGKKLAHIHVHDNHGEDDEHLGIGDGTVDWKNIARLLKKYSYNRTITLEVFKGQAVLKTSRKRLERFL